MKATLGLDVGTTSVKAVVIAKDGQLLCEGSSRAIPMRAPHSGWAIQATSDLHGAVIECLQATASTLASDVEVVSLTAAVQSGSVVTIDRSGRVAPDLTTWMDTRSASFVDQWHKDGTAELIREICGWTVQSGQGLPQLAWNRAVDTASWETMGRAASADDLVSNWLTGNWVTNPSNAAGMALMDIRTGQWSHELCDLIGLNTTQLSELRPSGEAIGHLNSVVAKSSGLNRNLTVINGGHDQACTALALGVDKPGQALLAGGTAWVLTSVIQPEEVDEIPAQMNVSFHVVPGLRTASKYLGGLGASIEWWLSSTGTQTSSESRFALLDADLAQTTTSSTSPYFRPSEDRSNKAQLPGAGTFYGTTAKTTNSDRARSITEYAAFKLRTALTALPTSHRPSEITIVGGATRCPGWTQLIADVCELPVTEAADRSWPALGAAILGGAATGLFSNVQDIVSRLNSTSKRLHPDSQKTEMYRQRYDFHLNQEAQK